MKKRTTQEVPLNDKDIAQVFNKQAVEVPEGIEAAIFEQAELTAAQNRTASTNQMHRSLAQPRTTPRKFPAWLPSSFAIAATVVLTIILAPTLIHAPNEIESDTTASMLDMATPSPQITSVNSNKSNSEMSRATTLMATESMQATLTESAADTNEPMQATLTESAAGTNEALPIRHNESATVVQIAPTHLPSAAQNNGRRASLSSVLTSDTLANSQANAKAMTRESSASMATPAADETVNMKSTPAYRASAELWINEIKILIADGDADEARQEYELFKKKHPDKALNFKPDFTHRAIESAPAQQSNEMPEN